jgi:hypothetical protein
MPDGFPLTVVDGLDLDEERQAALRPDAVVRDRNGRARRLPRFFYEIGSWTEALETRLSAHFGLYEFITVDYREVEVVRQFPRYIPCAVSILAAHLELFREKVGTNVYIAANGGYRSPSHRLSPYASPHTWGSAANVYRVGNDFLADRDTIEQYGAAARQVLPLIRVRPFGTGVGFADDHLHLDLGYVTVAPNGVAGERDS